MARKQGSNITRTFGVSAQDLTPGTNAVHGLDTYDYGARQLAPVLGRWDRMDPLCEKYYDISPYAYCHNNPANRIDPTGEGDIDQLFFALFHPYVALSIGTISKNSTNISTNAARFSRAIGLKENSKYEGSQVNAFRHTLWQATITNKFGSEIAKAVGDSHEENPKVNLNQKVFFGNNALSQADQSIDLLNNEIGRCIGKNSNSISMKDLANMVLDVFYNEGLYIAEKNANGSVSLKKEKLSKNSYDSAKEKLEQLNNNGFTLDEQENLDYY